MPTVFFAGGEVETCGRCGCMDCQCEPCADCNRHDCTCMTEEWN